MLVLQCDEHVKRSIIKGLQARGVEAYGVEEPALKGVSDVDLLTFCSRTKRVIVTNDDDFLKLSRQQEHNGIIFITSQYTSIGEVIRSIMRLVDKHSDEEFINSIFFVP